MFASNSCMTLTEKKQPTDTGQYKTVCNLTIWGLHGQTTTETHSHTQKSDARKKTPYFEVFGMIKVTGWLKNYINVTYLVCNKAINNQKKASMSLTVCVY